jgi:hypothetical protein
MATDRFVSFGAVRPTRAQIRRALVRYIGDPGAVKWSRASGRFVVTLPGEPRDAWVRPLAYPKARPRPVMNEERWFEVFPGGEDAELSVITRSADDITNAVATGFARACVYAFGTVREAEKQDWW